MKKKKSSNKVKTYHGIAIAEKSLMELLRLNCAKQIEQLGKEFFGEIKSIVVKDGKTFDFSTPDMRKVCQVVSYVLRAIQDSWSVALKEFAEATKLPRNFVPTGYQAAKSSKKQKPMLSKDEMGKIRALRKSGLSIKAIGKEIHRAEKVVRDFIKTF